MKRSDIQVGGEYATDTGMHVRIVDLEPGWAIDPETREWVQRPAYAKRFIRGKGFVEYQTNINIKAEEVPTGRKTVVEPRHLVGPWEDYAAQQEAVQGALALAQANGQALAARASRAGVEPLVDPEREEVVLDFAAFDSLLRLARV